MAEFKSIYKLSRNEDLNYKQDNYLKRPKVVEMFTEHGDHHVKYFQKPKQYPLDLNEGFEKYIFRTDEYYSHNNRLIDQYIMKSKNVLDKRDSVEEGGVYVSTRRAALLAIMSTPYSSQKWTVLATKFDNVIHLTVEQDFGYSTKNVTSTHAFKLRQYCFSDSPKIAPNTDEPINENRQNYALLEAQLRNFHIFYTAEFQGIESEKRIDLNTEENKDNLKIITTKILRKDREWLHDRKHLRTWLQCYLSHCEDIYFAFKDKNGIVHEPLEYISVDKLIAINKWKAHVCVGFLHKFLKMVEDQMAAIDSPHTVYEFKFDKGEISYKAHLGKTKKSFLSDDFIKYLKENNK